MLLSVEHARIELGKRETDAQLASLDQLAKKLLRKCIVDAVPPDLVHAVLDDMRPVLLPLGFSEVDVDRLVASFAAAVGLVEPGKLSAAAVKKAQQRRGVRRRVRD